MEQIKGGCFALIFSLAFFGSGALFFWLIGQVSYLTCHRVEPGQIDCLLEKKFWGLVPVDKQNLAHVNQAEVTDSCDEDGCTYRIELETSNGQIPFTDFYSGGSEDKRETANQINNFIQNSQERNLALRTPFSLTMLMPCLFMGIGLFMFGVMIKDLLVG